MTHLHGELIRLRSSRDSGLIVPIEGWEQRLDATAPDGSLLRPHIVFFGESVPMFERAAEIAQTADIMVVVGTSLAVYPAASLVRYVRPDIPIYVVDPGNPDTAGIRNPLTLIRKRAAEGMPELAALLRERYARIDRVLLRNDGCLALAGRHPLFCSYFSQGSVPQSAVRAACVGRRTISGP